MADDKKDFTVVDRRVSTEEEGSAAEDSGQDQDTKAAPEAGDRPGPAEGAAPGPEAGAGAEEAGEKGAPPPPVTFPTFLLSLHASALIHLGLIPDPVNKQKKVNLELARQNIDLLEMLQDKTEGNRTEDESKLLENILYELRMVYVQVCEGAGGEECES